LSAAHGLAIVSLVMLSAPLHGRHGDRLASPPASSHASPAPRRLSDVARSRTLATVAKAPMPFERNLGQADRRFEFVAAGAGYRVGLSPTGAAVTLTDRTDAPGAFRIVFEGANADATGAALDTLPGLASYYRGADPARWQVGASTHGRVRYAGIFDGIDVV